MKKKIESKKKNTMGLLQNNIKHIFQKSLIK